MFWTQPDAGTIIQPQAPSSGLSMRHFQPFLTPYPLHPLMIHPPTIVPQQRRYSAVTIATIFTRQPYDLLAQRHLIRFDHRITSLRRSWVVQHTANTSLRYPESLLNLICCPAPFHRAQKFPRAASFSIALSIDKSDTTLRSRLFSCSSSFKRFA